MASKLPHQRSQVFAAAFSRHLEGLAEHLAGAHSGHDGNAVHKLRVSGRRLRATLKLFADLVPHKKLRRWLKHFKRVRRRLGSARDLDVHIDALNRRLGKLTPEEGPVERPGLERLRLRFEQERRALQPEVAAAIERLERQKTVAECRAWIEQFKEAPSALRPKRARRRALGFALCEYVRVLALAGALQEPENTRGLHALRIAAKHLRYTLEIVEPLFPAGFAEQIDLAKSWQERLGDIHDDDVWLTRLPHFLAHERARYEAFFGHLQGFDALIPGIERLAAHCRRRRAERFQAFVADWPRQIHAAAWRALTET